MSLDSLMMVAREGIEHVREQLGPEEDWSPVLLLEREDDDGVTLVHAGDLMRHGMPLFCQAAATALRVIEATAVVFVSVATTAKVDSDELARIEEYGAGDPSDYDDARESLVVVGVDREGARLSCVQVIERHKDGPPTLADPEDDLGTMRGGVTDALLWGVGYEEEEG